MLALAFAHASSLLFLSETNFARFIFALIGRKPAKVSRLGADPTWKAMWRLIRGWVCHNHKLYYTYSIGCAFLVYQMWWNICVGYYRQRNAHRSLAFAQQKEREWEINKPKEEEYDDEDYGDEGGEEAPAEGGEEAAAEEGGDDADDDE